MNFKLKRDIVGKIVYATLLGLFLAGAANGQDLHYHISGKLQNISPLPAKLYLKEGAPAGLLGKPVDSAEVLNGEYKFSGVLRVDEAIAVTISANYSDKNTDHIDLMLDKGDLAITSDGSLNNVIITGSGSLANQQFERMRGSKQIADSIKAVVGSEAYKTDKELQLKIMNRSMQLATEILFNMYSYLKAHPEDRITPYGTYMMVALPLQFFNQAGKDTLIGLLPEKVKSDLLGQAILQLNDRNQEKRDSLIKVAQAKSMDNLSNVQLGGQALEITQNDPEGRSVSLSSLKGKYVLVDFWASWCKPCREENPNVVKLYNQYKSKGFTVYGVSLDGAGSKMAWIKAIEYDGLTWTQVSDLTGWNNAAAKAYDIKSIPQNFLIDPNGKVIAKNLRGGDLAKELAAIFNK